MDRAWTEKDILSVQYLPQAALDGAYDATLPPSRSSNDQKGSNGTGFCRRKISPLPPHDDLVNACAWESLPDRDRSQSFRGGKVSNRGTTHR